MGEINGKIAYANKIQILQQLYNFKCKLEINFMIILRILCLFKASYLQTFMSNHQKITFQKGS